jgi:hypothetical protein
MLSKMAKPKEKTIIEAYYEIAKKDLNKSKLPELKEYAKELRLKVSGNKDNVFTRIKDYMISTKHAIKIQRTVRRHLVAKWMKLKGSYKTCVNDSDFYTLEPFSEIPYLYYITYEDFTHNYGFNIQSLCTMAVKNNNKLENPYNRENMKYTFEHKLVNVIRLTNALFPNNELMKEIVELSENAVASPILTQILARGERHRSNTQEYAFFHRLRNLEQMTVNQRITELFIHIDSLGNYTQMQWLSQLLNRKLYFLAIKINQLWNILPRDLRSRICPYMSPFSEDIFGTHLNIDSPIDEVLRKVVRMTEVLVYSGIDDEHKNLGVMYFLSGLTIVSLDARAQLPWLYENYFAIMQ